MKRDMDLVRKILFQMEEAEGGYADNDFAVDGYDEDAVGHHVWLMEQAGLVTAADMTAQQSPSPVALPLSITWEGHEFLENVRSDTVWQQVKRTIQEKGGGLSFDLVKAVAVYYAKQHIPGLGDVG